MRRSAALVASGLLQVILVQDCVRGAVGDSAQNLYPTGACSEIIGKHRETRTGPELGRVQYGFKPRVANEASKYLASCGNSIDLRF